ncbi:MAG TPA: 3',5'-cyclic-nucleotide phosphodiesterase [Deltaproteobacteria bacterium]|nr:3',5'-cyclic-nucleotide phosphodiesterase [Deltaproteobacteria bacterium]
MKIEILGCSGAVTRGLNTTSILVDGSLLIDAGSVSSELSEDSIIDIRNILITHSHIDHIKELPFIVDALFCRKIKGVTVWGSEATLDILKRHVFNGLIWPEINDLYVEGGFLELKTIPREGFVHENIKVQAFPVNHIKGSVGYILSENNKSVIFSGDVGYDKTLFDFVESFGDSLAALFIEVSFPDEMDHLANVSHHLTPELLAKGLEGIVSSSTKVIAYHIKPKYLDTVVAQLSPRFDYIKGGEVFEF